MGQFDGLPSIRWSLRGLNEEGDEAWLIRGIARKLYHCPGCHGDIEVGAEHTVVQYVRRLGGTDHHHWHRRCAEELLIPELGNLKRVPASESSQSKLEARGRRQVRAAGAAGVSCPRELGSDLRADRPHLLVEAGLAAAAGGDRLRPARPARRAHDRTSNRLARPRQRAQARRRGRRRRGDHDRPACSARSSTAAPSAISLTHPAHEQAAVAARNRPPARLPAG